MKQRILALLLAAGLCLGLIAAAPALAFSDVSGEELSEAVEVLSGLGIVSGYSDRSYHPDDALTRAQFCKLAILTEGHGDQARGSAYRTRFSDVPGGGWAAPYINLACEEGLVSGYGDGRFGPDDPVTVGQAVTVVFRLLGYTAEEIGPFWPEDYLNKAVALGLLDGLPADGGAGLTRGDAALLLYRVLRQTDRDGQDYIDNLCASKVTGAVLLDNNAEAADGTLGTVEVYANQTINWYEPAEAVPDRLVGRKGALLLDEAGKTVGFLPDDSSHRTLRPAEVAADGITAAGGGTYAISSGTRVLLDGAVSTYGDCWYEPAEAVPDRLVGRKGALLLDEAGKAVGFLPDDSSHRTLRPAEVAADGITAAGGGTYAISSGTRVLLDGAVSTYGDCWYELEGREQVTLYYTDSGALDLVVASEAAAYEGVMLTGYYENASPNAASPASITLLGVELEVVDGAAAGLSAFAVGDRITVTLNGAGEVISACAPSEKRAELYGVLQEDGVELTCGLTAAGELSVHGAGVGELVRVSSTGIGALSAYPVSGGSQYALDPSDGTLGSLPLSEDVKLYERAGSSVVAEIALEDILTDTVPASQIDFYATDENGKVCLLLLDDVTGNAFTYGLLTAGEQTGGSGSMTYTNRTVSVENSSGASQAYITGKTVRSGTMGGIAVSSEGKAVEVVSLKKADVSRADFDGEEAVVVEGLRVPVSDGVEVYNQETGRWTTLSAAKSYGAELTVYYSGALGGDAVVRVVTVG